MKIFRTGSLHKGRIEAFSDGVFAIIITLLILELKVPGLEGESHDAELAGALIKLLPKFMSWVMSFAMVSIFWVNHHRLFNLLKHVDNGLLWLNCLFLLLLSFIPFPTALLGEYHREPLAVVVFGATMTLASLVFAWMRWYAVLYAKIVQDDLSVTFLKKSVRQSFLLGPFSYLAATLTALVHVTGAIVLYALIPLYFILPRNVEDRDSTRERLAL
ncbi:DUF1211 domain-containing protein [candidate division KSB1 bacterium]|nr:DUF1211 domain-containing protein [candidate division KSB1 bacterium]